ncbi:MAG: TIGR04282 family arsenosugar biosynthesis glycosyltransferase [Methylophaga sp.]|nr:TIGR04282 family arsenosugar biosynthesis glycosyltransferase [Methylophaga sp.]
MQTKYPDTAILVFCKAPVAGQVKTRLMPQLSAQQAADVHMQLTKRILSLLSRAHCCPIQLWCSPDTNHPFFEQCAAQYDVSLHLQQGADLGERMNHAICAALEKSSTVLLIGCDCPSFKENDFESAIDFLQLEAENGVVIAPADDGGYVMIGMNKSYPELFINMTWSHKDVYNNTVQRIVDLELTLFESRRQWDIDTFEDLQRFRDSNKP